jgi:Phage portal protein, SPP1 Gp6-like
MNGPRLSRYAQAASFYLGHQWAYRAAPGEPQLTANYCSTLSDFLVNFSFSKGISFGCDPEFTHIVPALLERIWDQDNRKNELLWSMGNIGSIYGDCFVKVAYEPAWMNEATGDIVPGRVRILPLNPSFCFPDWHPHDKDRLVRFKLKYRYWGTSPQGTRMPHTYVEIITDEWIEEYIDDQMIDRRENPLGEIPVVHIANKPVAASPWGLSDIQDIMPLNRTFNELATDILDIVAYHTAPVTIITGAKATNLERGANKIWAIPQKDAKVENLTGGFDGIQTALDMMDRVKLAMHEISGVPENALGKEQQVSNTSGVALAIQYFPTMLRFNLKVTQYGNACRKISQIALRTLFMAEPATVRYDQSTMGIMRDNQPLVINPADPQVYNLKIKFPPPLPQDELVVLNELQAKLMLELESKKGALAELGEQFPDEKLQELFEEQIDDLKMTAAKRIVNAQVDAAIMMLTGVIPQDAGQPMDGGESSEQTTTKPDGTKTKKTTNATPAVQGPATPALPSLPGLGNLGTIMNDMGGQTIKDLVVQAMGTKLPQRRIVSVNDNDDTNQG